MNFVKGLQSKSYHTFPQQSPRTATVAEKQLANGSKSSMKQSSSTLNDIKPVIQKLKLLDSKLTSLAELVLQANTAKNRVPLKYASFFSLSLSLNVLWVYKQSWKPHNFCLLNRIQRAFRKNKHSNIFLLLCCCFLKNNNNYNKLKQCITFFNEIYAIESCFNFSFHFSVFSIFWEKKIRFKYFLQNESKTKQVALLQLQVNFLVLAYASFF